MDTKSKIFFLAFILILEGSIFSAYYRFVIAKDYIVENQEDCDPTIDRCFIWECDPNAKDPSEQCTGDPDNDTWYYKLSFRNASKVPLCDPDNDENCTPMVCEPGEKDCYDVFCSDEANKKYEQEATCNDPVEYVKNNPEEEEDADSEEGAESEECAPDDQECLDASDESQSEEASSQEECAADDETCTEEAQDESVSADDSASAEEENASASADESASASADAAAPVSQPTTATDTK
ncbi:MAG: hypothetical protein HGB08_03630 [Candidatus Moranbacteria bacterium]|nr:hypothetical protein [Candidatus Moranbacteria bacterium]